VVRRVILLVLGSLVATLLLTTVALAGWTPQDIYQDFAKNGKLTREYTQAELRAYLNDATIAQYADSDVKKRLDSEVNSLVDRDEFPFTGFQLMMAGIVALALVGGGVALRRISRSQRSSQKT
jgi:hypothetical protein